jgi:hypothetical protein
LVPAPRASAPSSKDDVNVRKNSDSRVRNNNSFGHIFFRENLNAGDIVLYVCTHTRFRDRAMKAAGAKLGARN